jgi:drug/metabolite transporter (DMT)-like permease
MLKISANKKHGSVKAEYLNPLVIGAYLLFFGSSLIVVFAFKYVPLLLAPVFEALGYVFIGILGFTVLKERLTTKKLLGMAFIVAGVIVCSLGLS